MAKNKGKGTKGRGGALASKPVGGMAIAATWPIYEVLLSHGWDKEGALVTVLIARFSPTSEKIAAAYLLIDLACLGVKDAQVRFYKNIDEYYDGIRDRAFRVQQMAPTNLNLAVKIIYTGVEYAARWGFKPHAVYAQAVPLFADADPEADPTPVPTGGAEGKPLFINGPYDDARKIIDHLVKTVGVGNFNYILGGPASKLELPDGLEGKIIED